MKGRATKWGLLLAASQLLACSHVSSSTAGPDNMAGDAWYVRTTWFLWLPVGSSIWHCPEPTRSGPVICREATVHDVDESIEALNNRPATDAPPTMIYTGDKKSKKGKDDDESEDDEPQPIVEEPTPPPMPEGDDDDDDDDDVDDAGGEGSSE